MTDDMIPTLYVQVWHIDLMFS